MKEPVGKRSWHIDNDIKYVFINSLIKCTFVWLHKTGTPTNGQNAGDLMPNASRREKGRKCGRVGSSRRARVNRV